MPIRSLSFELFPFELTSEYVSRNHAKMGLDRRIVDLVCALLDTGVVATTYSCEGHFNTHYAGSFCHHNQKAQVRFQVKDKTMAIALCHEILEVVVFDDLSVQVVMSQNKGGPEDEIEIDWCLEYRPVGFWEMRPQDSGMYIQVGQGWTEMKARKLLARAFKQTIKVCRKGQWRVGCTPRTK